MLQQAENVFLKYTNPGVEAFVVPAPLHVVEIDAEPPQEPHGAGLDADLVGSVHQLRPRLLLVDRDLLRALAADGDQGRGQAYGSAADDDDVQFPAPSPDAVVRALARDETADDQEGGEDRIAGVAHGSDIFLTGSDVGRDVDGHIHDVVHHSCLTPNCRSKI